MSLVASVSPNKITWQGITEIHQNLPQRINLTRTLWRANALFAQGVFKQDERFRFVQTNSMSNTSLQLDFDVCEDAPSCYIGYVDRDWLVPYKDPYRESRQESKPLVPYTIDELSDKTSINGSNVLTDDHLSFADNYLSARIGDTWARARGGIFKSHFEAAFKALHDLKGGKFV